MNTGYPHYLSLENHRYRAFGWERPDVVRKGHHCVCSKYYNRGVDWQYRPIITHGPKRVPSVMELTYGNHRTPNKSFGAYLSATTITPVEVYLAECRARWKR